MDCRKRTERTQSKNRGGAPEYGGNTREKAQKTQKEPSKPRRLLDPRSGSEMVPREAAGPQLYRGTDIKCTQRHQAMVSQPFPGAASLARRCSVATEPPTFPAISSGPLFFCAFSRLFLSIPPARLITGLGFFGGQVLLKLSHLRGHHQLAIALGRILGEIVLMIFFGSVKML
jgi:hypothetical protein